MNNSNVQKNTLYLWNGIFFFLGNVVDTAFHRHHAVQLVLGLENKFTIDTDNETHQTKAVLLDSDIVHRLQGPKGVQALLLFENESKTAQKLKNVLKNETMLLLPEDSVSEHLKSGLKKLYMGKPDIDSAKVHLDLLLSKLFSFSNEVQIVDPRIVKARALIDSLEVKKISADRISSMLSISETRFIHLFKKEVGIPFRKYLLWKRMLDSIRILIDRHDITWAAHEAGFSDSAHLARTFKDNFGVVLSEIFKNDRFVQVIIDNSL